MVEKPRWLSMRHFVTKEYLQGLYMGQKQYEICNTNLIDNGLMNSITECTIFSSSLLRSQQTVDYLCHHFKEIKFEVVYSESLVERGMGDFEGNLKQELRKNGEYFLDGRLIVDKTPPNGESFLDFKKRVENFLPEIREKKTTKNVLVVSHLQVLRMIWFFMNKEYNLNKWYEVNYNHGEIVEEFYG